jgi:uracil-DNA glycosylase family 4
MEDAAAKLAQLAEEVTACRRCEELANRRLRAVPGVGHPHAHVMVVAPCPSESDEADAHAAGHSLLAELAALLPGLVDNEKVDVYVTALVKCLPREGPTTREPLNAERDACFNFLSMEISTITPHFLIPVVVWAGIRRRPATGHPCPRESGFSSCSACLATRAA